MYKHFEERVRTATPESLRASQKFFVDIFVSHGARRVLDLGSGNGIFLDLAKEAGIEGVGIESDEPSVADSAKRGHTVMHGDVLEILKSDIGVFDGIFASHLIEHFDPKRAFELVSLAYKTLASGGIFVVVTPNVKSIIQHLRYFYCDYTHVRFYPEELLTFFFEEAGFRNVTGSFRPDSVYFELGKLGLMGGKIPSVPHSFHSTLMRERIIYRGFPG